MGVSPGHSYEDFWKDNDFLGLSGFKNTMTYNRCENRAQYICENAAAGRKRGDNANYHPVNKVKSFYVATD